MTAAALFLSLVPLAVQMVPGESGVTTSEKLVARGLTAAVITLILLVRKRESLVSRKPWLLFLEYL